MNIPNSRIMHLVGLLLLFSILLTACGSADSPAPSEAQPEAAPTDPPAPPTDIPAPTDAPASVEYADPPGDCLDNSNNAIACTPLGVDILSVSISRQSPLTIVLEIAADGFDDLRTNGNFGVIFGLDLDQDASTGHTSFWPTFHGMGPDLEIRYLEENGGVVTEDVSHFAVGGTKTAGDASQVTWTVLDNNHIQVVLSEELIPDQPFSISGDLFTPDLYDHFVDDGHLTFPAGEVNLVE